MGQKDNFQPQDDGQTQRQRAAGGTWELCQHRGGGEPSSSGQPALWHADHIALFRTNMPRQRGGERTKASVPEPTAGVICALKAKQQAHGFAVLCSQGKQDIARPSFGPLRIHKAASGSCGGHVIPNCVLFNLALQTANLLLSWPESSVSHLGGAYLFSWVGKLKKSLMLTHVKCF